MVVTMLGEGEYRRLDAHCKDLSEAGIGMLVAAELPLGEVASLSFSLPGSPAPWEVRAVLRHRRGYHYGFEFLSLNPEQSRTLGGYLQNQARADKD
ncbi:MAG: PilZ domain-containing protein [Acidobacteriia bacterium]|nr:PilZ domain-containing protein [Terriglobia bacterium]